MLQETVEGIEREVYGGGFNLNVFKEALARKGEGTESHKESLERSSRILFSLGLMKLQTGLVRDRRGMRMDIPRHTWALKDLSLKEYQNLVFLSYCCRKKGMVISVLCGARCQEREMNIQALSNFVEANVTQHVWDEQSDLISITRLVVENAELCSMLWLKMTQGGTDRINYSELVKEPWMWGLKVSEEVRADMMVEENVRKACEFLVVENSMVKVKAYMSMLVDPNAFSHTKCLRDGNKGKVMPSNGDFFTKADLLKWIRNHHLLVQKEAGTKTDVLGAKVVRNSHRFSLLTGVVKEAWVQTDLTTENRLMTEDEWKMSKKEEERETATEYDSLSSSAEDEEEKESEDKMEVAMRIANIIIEQKLLKRAMTGEVRPEKKEKQKKSPSASTSVTMEAPSEMKVNSCLSSNAGRQVSAEELKKVIEGKDEWAASSSWD